MSDPIGRAALSAVQRFQAAQGAPLGMDGGLQVPFTRENAGVSFGDTLTRAIGEVSAAQERSNDMSAAFVRGEPVELHQVMAAAEEASLSLELLVEVRNKFSEAYRTLINMQG